MNSADAPASVIGSSGLIWLPVAHRVEGSHRDILHSDTLRATTHVSRGFTVQGVPAGGDGFRVSRVPATLGSEPRTHWNLLEPLKRRIGIIGPDQLAPLRAPYHPLVRLALAVLASLGVVAAARPAPQAASIRVLFIGNSLTGANDLPGQVRAIAQAAGAGPTETAAVVRPGFSLEDHWTDGVARRAIAADRWNLVVLQQGPSSQPESRLVLREYVRRFDREIRRAGARTALYMVWPSRARLRDFDAVRDSYTIAARDVDGLLMPAGEAWRAAWRHDAGLPFYDRDEFHPSTLGSYLAALTVVAALTGRTLSGAPAPAGSPAGSDRIEGLLRAAASEAAGHHIGVTSTGRQGRRLLPGGQP